MMRGVEHAPVIDDRGLTDLGSYSVLIRHRSGFQDAFCSWLSAERALDGRVLDIGCGGAFPNALQPLAGRIRWLDGVDPSPGVITHPGLRERWQGKFEEASVPADAYDLALAYNVAEHIEDPRRFLSRVATVLKPGGVFWFLTPHARHPFSHGVRFAQRFGGRGWLRNRLRGSSGQAIINDYPAYYRMNRRRDVLMALDGLPFGGVRFCYLPCMQWDQYLPPSLRWMAHLYDACCGIRFASCALLFACRLEKVATADGVLAGGAPRRMGCGS